MANIYNQEFQSNNTDLQAILNKINTLPNAGTSSTGPRCVTGYADSDDCGVLYLPPLDFDPKMIVVWNIEERDIKEEDGISDEDWDDSQVRYFHTGILLTAILVEGTWVAQVVADDSGGTHIANDSAEIDYDGDPDNLPYGAQAIVVYNDRSMEYRLYRGSSVPPESVYCTGFEYAIYG